MLPVCPQYQARPPTTVQLASTAIPNLLLQIQCLVLEATCVLQDLNTRSYVPLVLTSQSIKCLHVITAQSASIVTVLIRARVRFVRVDTTVQKAQNMQISSHVRLERLAAALALEPCRNVRPAQMDIIVSFKHKHNS